MDIDTVAPISLMFQTGYLTVRSVKRRAGFPPIYALVMPNNEVRDAFNRHIFMSFTETDANAAQSTQQTMLSALESGEPERLETVLNGIFASIPYEIHIDREAYYQSVFYCITQMLGFRTDAEVSTSRGRIDGVLELPERVYILEFKYRKGAETDEILREAASEAMAQIDGRGYAERYAGCGKEVIKAAVGMAGRGAVRVICERYVSNPTLYQNPD